MRFSLLWVIYWLWKGNDSLTLNIKPLSTSQTHLYPSCTSRFSLLKKLKNKIYSQLGIRSDIDPSLLLISQTQHRRTKQKPSTKISQSSALGGNTQVLVLNMTVFSTVDGRPLIIKANPSIYTPRVTKHILYIWNNKDKRWHRNLYEELFFNANSNMSCDIITLWVWLWVHVADFYHRS